LLKVAENLGRTIIYEFQIMNVPAVSWLSTQ